MLFRSSSSSVRGVHSCSRHSLWQRARSRVAELSALSPRTTLLSHTAPNPAFYHNFYLKTNTKKTRERRFRKSPRSPAQNNNKGARPPASAFLPPPLPTISPPKQPRPHSFRVPLLLLALPPPTGARCVPPPLPGQQCKISIERSGAAGGALGEPDAGQPEGKEVA